MQACKGTLGILAGKDVLFFIFLPCSHRRLKTFSNLSSKKAI